MPSQVTVTAKTGPGVTITAQVFTNLRRFDLNLAANTLTIVADQSNGEPIIFSLTGVTTLTDSISSGVHTLVVS